MNNNANTNTNNNGWIECFCVCSFDIELGQKIDQIYPSQTPLSASQQSDIAYLSFPDGGGASGQKSSSTKATSGSSQHQHQSNDDIINTKYTFRITCNENSTIDHQLVRSELDLVRSNRSRSGSGSSNTSSQKKSNNGGDDGGDEGWTHVSSSSSSLSNNTSALDSEYLFGHVYFRQRKDSSVHRGYVMKSVVLLTRLPFLKLFRFLSDKVAELYFMNDEKLAPELFSQVMKQTSQWRVPMPDTQFNLSFMNQKIMYRSPLYCPSKRQLLMFGKDASLSSSSTVSTVNQADKRGTSSGSVEQKSGSSSPLRNNSSGQKKRFDKSSGVTPVTPLKERLLGRKYPFQHELNLFSTFRRHVENNNLVKYWELVISGEPILVVSSNPTMCCDAVLGLVSMIAPIHYAGDYRPYMTVHNTEFKSFAKLGDPDPFVSCIVGTTNPFFIKAYEQWPHIIIAGSSGNSSVGGTGRPASEETTTAKASSLLSSLLNSNPLVNKKKQNEEKRKQLMWDTQETFWTSKTNFVIKSSFQGSDTSWNHLSTNLLYLDSSDRNKESADGVNNDQIRKFFEELTDAFLTPIHRCFDTLVCSMKTFIVRSEHAKVFKPERFYHYVEKHGYNEDIFEGKRGDVLDLYKRFIASPNFSSWMDQRILEAYYNDVLHTDISTLLRDVSEVGMIDLFLRLKEELELERHGMGLSCGDAEVMSRLQLFLIQILQCLPQSISDNLARQLESMGIKVNQNNDSNNKSTANGDGAAEQATPLTTNIEQEASAEPPKKLKPKLTNQDAFSAYFK